MAQTIWMADMWHSFFSRPIGPDIGAPVAGLPTDCLPNEAIEKSLDGGLRCGPCRCRLADHAQALDETDENPGGTRRLDAIGQLARRLGTGKGIHHPGFHGFEKARDAT